MAGGPRATVTDLRMVVELLPTPTAPDHKGQNQCNDATCLPGAIALLPTPRANMGESRNSNAWVREDGPQNLENAIGEIALLPTPTARLGMPRGAQAATYTNPERSVDLDDAIAWMTGQTGSDSPTPSDAGSVTWEEVPLPLW
jgi:hypothetical protein